MRKSDKIFVAGHRGLVGQGVLRCLARRGYDNVVSAGRERVDLTRQAEVEVFFAEERPDVVIVAAAKVGGIVANRDLPGDFIRDNLLIQTHVLEAARRAGVRKTCMLGSSCIYPRLAAQPIVEESLLNGPLEATNEAYAVAKIAGLTMAKAYRRQYGMDVISLMPTNLYGPGDNFDPQHSHVIPGLMRRMHEAKLSAQPSFVVWGSGNPRREFLHVDDLAEAIVHCLRVYSDDVALNVGTGADLPIRELAFLIREVVGYRGALVFDRSKPDGTPRKRLDVSRIQTLGWRPTRELREGLVETYRWFLAHHADAPAATRDARSA